MNTDIMNQIQKLIESSLMDECKPQYVCRAVTRDKKKCTRKACCRQNTVCKMHKDFVVPLRRSEIPALYHNHLPGEYRGDCLLCSKKLNNCNNVL